jgi:hypothetical protein
MTRYLVIALTLMAAATPASAATLVDCLDGVHGGDAWDRGFYVPIYPGRSLDQVDMMLAADIPGTYTMRLTARAGTYDGALIGLDEVTLSLPAYSGDPIEVNFIFDDAPVEQGSVVTFALEMIGESAVYYDTHSNNPSCPIVQTNYTVPPLDEFRRDGLRMRIQGDEATPNESVEWSRIKGIYR